MRAMRLLPVLPAAVLAFLAGPDAEGRGVRIIRLPIVIPGPSPVVVLPGEGVVPIPTSLVPGPGLVPIPTSRVPGIGPVPIPTSIVPGGGFVPIPTSVVPGVGPVPIPTSIVPGDGVVPIPTSLVPGSGPIPYDLPIPVTGAAPPPPWTGPVQELAEWLQAAAWGGVPAPGTQPGASGYPTAVDVATEAEALAANPDAGVAAEGAAPARRSPIYVPEAFAPRADETTPGTGPGEATPPAPAAPGSSATSASTGNRGDDSTGSPLVAMMLALLTMPPEPEPAAAPGSAPAPAPAEAGVNPAGGSVVSPSPASPAAAAPESPPGDGRLPPAQPPPPPRSSNPVAALILSSVVQSWTE